MSKKPTEKESNEKEQKSTSPQPEPPRRDFLKVSVAAGVGACAVGAPVCAAVRLVTAPVFAEGSSGKSYPFAAFDSLTDKPEKFSIVVEKNDAWTTVRETISVFLRKVGDNEVLAFQAKCPHAGCAIQFGSGMNPDTKAEEELFLCPCHPSLFDLNGKRLNDVSPRYMDSLEAEVKDGQVFVKFEKFTFGIAEKKAR
jgi:menaquinol-cytochrome c reductase iron-sulfur subunit